MTHKQLLIGLPNTGKTTFLAALWYVVDTKEISPFLTLDRVEGDREYINEIRHKWVGCEPLGRTLPADEQVVPMRLHDRDTGKSTTIVFPDISGESFRRQWENREWTYEYATLVDECDGILLFLHPEATKPSRRIDEANELLGELIDINTDNELNKGKSDRSAISDEQWDYSQASTQVKTVDLLQFVCHHRLDSPFPIAVIISAWDIVMKQSAARGQNVTTDDWLETQVPLLHQYLLANSLTNPYCIFGVSAQGGDLDKDTTRLLEKALPSERIIVVGPDCAQNDLTAPVAWLLRNSHQSGEKTNED